MTPKLSDEQRQALRETADAGPVRVVDPLTNTEFILVRADVYQQMQGLLDEFDPRQAYPFVDEVLREDDEHDPSLASYQDSQPNQRPS